ncbi:hypothetical protein BDR03DRAFT_1010431 [Suillus americanus]|nr:hypothetical protein BDR03DRAFT_1010431 [Suillus americanus]
MSSLPTRADLEAQAKSLACSAAISQQASLTIMELDVEDADLKKRYTAYGVLLEERPAPSATPPNATVRDCTTKDEYVRVQGPAPDHPGSLIKPSFPQPGLKHSSHATMSAEETGLATAMILACPVPVAVEGIIFLSGKTFIALLPVPSQTDILCHVGGLSDPDAVKFLNAVNIVAD